MSIVRYDPFREIMNLSDRLQRILSDSSARLPSDDFFGAWIPPVDIFEKADGLTLRAELPGMSKEDIDIRIENGILTLHGERKREADVDEKNAHRLERMYGSFTRSFTLPTSVDAGKISARYQNGVLELVLPKAEEAKPKRIQIQGA